MKLVVDASAMLAVLLDEPEAATCLAKLMTASKAWISPVNWWEVQVRMQALYGDAGAAKSASWMHQFGLLVEPVTAEHAHAAAEAFRRYRGRPTRLNMGDCFAYALAQTKGAPLLFKGNDFRNTDIVAA